MAFWRRSDDERTSQQDKAKVAKGKPSEALLISGSEDLSSSEAKLSVPRGTMSPEETLLERFGKIRSALGVGTVIQGKLSFDTPVRIDGKLSGEIFSSKALIVGQSGEIDAHIQAAVLIVMGRVKGEVTASHRIEIWGQGVVESNVCTPILVVQEGCVFSGECRMGQAQQSMRSALQGAKPEASPGVTPDNKQPHQAAKTGEKTKAAPSTDKALETGQASKGSTTTSDSVQIQ